MPYGPRTRTLAVSLPVEKYRELERLAAVRQRSMSGLARDLCAQGVGLMDGRRVVVELDMAAARSLADLAGRYGLDVSDLLGRVVRGIHQAPSFVEGHILRNLGGMRR